MEAEVQKMYLCPKNYKPNCKCNTVNCTNCFHSNYKTLDEAIKSSNLITVFLISQYSTVILVLLHLFVYFSENMVGQDFHQMGETAGSTHSILLLLTVLLHVFSYCGPYWCSLSKTKHMGYSFHRHNKKCEDAVLALWNTLNMLRLLLIKAFPAGSFYIWPRFCVFCWHL